MRLGELFNLISSLLVNVLGAPGTDLCPALLNCKANTHEKEVESEQTLGES